MSILDRHPPYQAVNAENLLNGITLVPFTAGDGAWILLSVKYHAEFLRGADGTCAFCHGDPCAEDSAPESLIATYFARNRAWAESCPCCHGRPT